MAMGAVFISRKSCKTYKNTVKSKMYALLYIVQNCPVDQIGFFAGQILSTGPYVWHLCSKRDLLPTSYVFSISYFSD